MNAEKLAPATASTYFEAGYNCAQSVLLALQRLWNVENPLDPKVASAFGGGIGRKGSVCGALTGGIIAVGLKYGSNSPLAEEREKAYSLAREFYDAFEKRCGSVLCKELIGCDLTNLRELQKARKLRLFQEKCTFPIEEAVRVLIELDR